MSRFDSFKNLINAGGYKLADIKERIHGIADRGEVTLEERDRLLALAQEHANPLDETDKGAKLLELEARLRRVEAQLAAIAGGEGGEGEETVPEFVVGKWYYAGDRVTFDGAVYACIAPEGVACVWSPADYPAYWQAA